MLPLEYNNLSARMENKGKALPDFTTRNKRIEKDMIHCFSQAPRGYLPGVNIMNSTHGAHQSVSLVNPCSPWAKYAVLKLSLSKNFKSQIMTYC